MSTGKNNSNSIIERAMQKLRKMQSSADIMPQKNMEAEIFLLRLKELCEKQSKEDLATVVQKLYNEDLANLQKRHDAFLQQAEQFADIHKMTKAEKSEHTDGIKKRIAGELEDFQAQYRFNQGLIDLDLVNKPQIKESPKEMKELIASLKKMNYLVYPVDKLRILFCVTKIVGKKADPPLNQLALGSTCDVICNGTFYGNTDEHSIAPYSTIIRNGKCEYETKHPKVTARGGLAILQDEEVVISQADGSAEQAIQKTFGKPGNKVMEFIGGGALLVKNGAKISGENLFQNQMFTQMQKGKEKSTSGLDSDQLRCDFHIVFGLHGGQLYLIIPDTKKYGKTIQNELHSKGFDSVIKFDGGRACYLNSVEKRIGEDKSDARNSPTGFCIKNIKFEEE